ncbi:hypothetical protein [Streptomyces sp. NPDC091209]|uniref:hypothetical protein n=1 Tax=Streptomyces sp. NPDC091209 TaxID=3365974 RepID=UPI0037FEE05D
MRSENGWRIRVGSYAPDPEVLADSNITHLGTSEPGKKQPDFVIGDSYNVDVTGARKTSIAEHMGRDCYEHQDQLMTYPTLRGADIAKIFGGAGE